MKMISRRDFLTDSSLDEFLLSSLYPPFPFRRFSAVGYYCEENFEKSFLDSHFYTTSSV